MEAGIIKGDGALSGQNIAIHFKKAVNTIAVDTTGKFAALGGFVLVHSSEFKFNTKHNKRKQILILNIQQKGNSYIRP
jgi:hypothetical protein